MIKSLSVLILVLSLFACTKNKKTSTSTTKVGENYGYTQKSGRCILEDSLKSGGLVDIRDINSNIMVNLRYSSLNNILHQDIYGCLENAFLQNETAIKLGLAQEYLSEINANYHLLIWDAIRPRSAQQRIWDALSLPYIEKVKYAADPKQGSIHNYGCAVDLTICQNDGKLLDMGTDFDHFGPASNISKEYVLLTDSTLNYKQLDNRKLLRSVMKKAGFTTIESEWWHFNSMTRKEAQQHYSIIE